jgi:hypothetical protein
MSATPSAAQQFVNALRVRPGVLEAAPVAAAQWMLRVQAADVFDAVRVACEPTTRVADMKALAMQALLPDVAQHDSYLVKLHGAEITNETLTLEQVGARNASTLFLTSRRRRPLR